MGGRLAVRSAAECVELKETPVGEGGGAIKTLWGFVLSSCHCNPRQSTTHTRVLLVYVLTLKNHTHTHSQCINPTMCIGPLLSLNKACQRRDREGGGAPATLITHTHITHSMKPSADPPIIHTHRHTHRHAHLLIRHGQLVLATVNRRAGGRGIDCMGAGRW